MTPGSSISRDKGLCTLRAFDSSMRPGAVQNESPSRTRGLETQQHQAIARIEQDQARCEADERIIAVALAHLAARGAEATYTAAGSGRRATSASR